MSSRSPELSSWNSGPSRPAANSALRARRASISLGAFPAARQQALAQHLGFHPEQDREQIRIAPAGAR